MNAFNNFFAEFSGFNLIETAKLVKQLMYIPEIDSFTLNFMNAGFTDYLVIQNLGLLFFMFAAHFLFIPIVLLMI